LDGKVRKAMGGGDIKQRQAEEVEVAERGAGGGTRRHKRVGKVHRLQREEK